MPSTEKGLFYFPRLNGDTFLSPSGTGDIYLWVP